MAQAHRVRLAEVELAVASATTIARRPSAVK
jgi:hypothetical protein